MEILVSTSKVKEQNMSAKVTVQAGKATKTKPAMAKIIVSTAAKKNAAEITFKPTPEATIEKPKYTASLKRMGKGFRMKNAAECIAALKVFGFDPKDAKPIRDFFAGRTTAAQFKKAMGTKTYTAKEDAKALDVIKLVNAAKLPTSGKGKVTRKMVDAIFADYQRFPIIREVDVKKLLKAIEAHNAGTLKPAALKSIRSLFARSQTNKRNPKISAMAKHFNAAIAAMESEAPAKATTAKPRSTVRPTPATKKKLPKVVLARAARTALNRFTADAKAKGRKLTKFNKAINALAEGNATDQMILDAIVEQASGGVTYLDKVKSMGRFSPDIRKVFEQVAKRNTTKTAKPKADKAPAGKAQGTQISNDDFNLELPIESKLTAAEANKIMAYFSKLLANKEVAKAQANRALKELVEGSMTAQMKKRWLARIGGSEIRPVPRKLVTVLREGETSGSPKPRATKSADTPKPRKTVRPTPNSTPTAIAKAVTEAGYKGVLATRQRGDLIEIYNKSGDGSVLWSWNTKTQKAIDYTAKQINHMYSTLDLNSMTQTEKVGIVADILKSMS